jgi:hypothetical protein
LIKPVLLIQLNSERFRQDEFKDEPAQRTLYQHLKGLMFEPLKDKNFFKKVTLDAELQTITWSNGADFAPEFLKDHLEND